MCFVMSASVLIAWAFPANSGALEVGVVPDLTWGDSAAKQDRTTAALTDVHARWVRLNIDWSTAEPARGSYDGWWLQQYDGAVQRARSAGMKIVMMVYTTPSWASGSSDENAPPSNVADFAHFMSFVAKRYAGKVNAYEIWNEENYKRFWSTGPSASAYTALLKAAYPAVKAADPNARVAFGGLSTNDYTFVEQAYAAGAKPYFDVMVVHPYTCAGSPEEVRYSGERITEDSFTGYREVRASMLARGDDKPIWFTEFGWSTASAACGVSEATQADYLTKALTLAEQDPYVQVALWYNFRNNYYLFDANALEAQYGLMRTNFSVKPAYLAFKSHSQGSPAAPSLPPTNSPPTVELTAPTAGSKFDKTLVVSADAGDDKAVTRVEFRFDSRRIRIARKPPYTYTWRVPNRILPGTHTVEARAIDRDRATASDFVDVVRSTTP